MILSLYSPLRARAEEPPPPRTHSLSPSSSSPLNGTSLSLSHFRRNFPSLVYSPKSSLSLFITFGKEKPAPLETTGHFFKFLSLSPPFLFLKLQVVVQLVDVLVLAHRLRKEFSCERRRKGRERERDFSVREKEAKKEEKKPEKRQKSPLFTTLSYLLRLDLPRRVRRHAHQNQEARPGEPSERRQARQLLHERRRRGERPQKGGSQDRHPVERARDVLCRRPPGANGGDARALLLELLGEVGRVELEEGVVVVEEDDQGDGGLFFFFFPDFFFGVEKSKK